MVNQTYLLQPQALATEYTDGNANPVLFNAQFEFEGSHLSKHPRKALLYLRICRQQHRL